MGPYIESAPFWKSLDGGKLALQFCEASGKFQHYPKPVSVYSGRQTLAWREVRGTGSVYSCTVLPASAEKPAQCVAIVELDEGVRMLARMIECRVEDVAIGRRVVLCMDRLATGSPYPAFTLA